MNEKEISMEIKKLQKKLSDVKKAKKCIRSLSTYTDSEKIELFDALYNQALEHLEDTRTNGYPDDDTEHYMFESVMNLLGENIWDYYNALCD